MTDREILTKLFKGISSDIKADQIAKGIYATGRSAESLREEIEDTEQATEGYLFGLSYLAQQETGTPPGTWPDYGDLYRWSIAKDIRPRGRQPRGAMIRAIQRKIYERGTDIYLKKRPGLDLTGILERNLTTALKELKAGQAARVASDIVDKFNDL